MIWHKKLRELADAEAFVFRVVIPTHRQPKCSGFIFIAGHEELFSTRYQAETYAAKFPDADAVIYPEPATLYV